MGVLQWPKDLYLQINAIDLKGIPFKSPCLKGDLRTIFKLFEEIPPAPLLKRGKFGA
jgi:hypothetical protein